MSNASVVKKLECPETRDIIKNGSKDGFQGRDSSEKESLDEVTDLDKTHEFVRTCLLLRPGLQFMLDSGDPSCGSTWKQLLTLILILKNCSEYKGITRTIVKDDTTAMNQV